MLALRERVQTQHRTGLVGSLVLVFFRGLCSGGKSSLMRIKDQGSKCEICNDQAIKARFGTIKVLIPVADLDTG